MHPRNGGAYFGYFKIATSGIRLLLSRRSLLRCTDGCLYAYVTASLGKIASGGISALLLRPLYSARFHFTSPLSRAQVSLSRICTTFHRYFESSWNSINPSMVAHPPNARRKLASKLTVHGRRLFLSFPIHSAGRRHSSIGAFFS